MTKTVTEMAREAGLDSANAEFPDTWKFERFVALVREDEREKLKKQASKPDYMVDAPVTHPFKSGGRYDF